MSSIDTSRTNYDAFIAKLYKYGSFITYGNYVELKLVCESHITRLTLVFLYNDTFSLESVEHDGKLVSVQPFTSSNILCTISALSKYIGHTIYKEIPHYKIIQN